MDALIKTVLDYARYLREHDVDTGGDHTGRDNSSLGPSGSVWRAIGHKGKSKK